MKKFTTVSTVFILSVFFLLSCSPQKTYDEGFEDGYDMGYYDASVDFEDDYSRGYYEGISRAQAVIESRLIDELFGVKEGMYPEDAVQILTNYADDPDSISKDELYDVIWSIHRYFYDSMDAIHSVTDYWID